MGSEFEARYDFVDRSGYPTNPAMQRGLLLDAARHVIHDLFDQGMDLRVHKITLTVHEDGLAVQADVSKA